MKGRAALMVALVATACGSGQAASGVAPSAPAGVVTVFAAASLTNALETLGMRFQARYARSTVRFNFAGSPTLVTQLAQGASADVLATADMTNMERARQAGLLGGPSTVFAHNLLEIAVAPGNPKRVTTLKDLARPDVTLVLAAPEVPAGRYAAQALARAHVDAKPRSLETDVESVLAKVELGEADAGVVYATDVRAAGSRVQGVAIPPTENIVAAYPAAELKKAPNPSGARAFLAYLEAPEARQVLQRYGFQPG